MLVAGALIASATSAVATGGGIDTATLNDALLLVGLLSFNAPVEAAPVTPVDVCRKLIEALTTAPDVTLARVDVANTTIPVTEL